MNRDIPCRVSADLRAKMAREDQHVPVEFDWENEDHVRSILTPSQHLLIKPIMELLASFHAIDRAERSFGTLDYKGCVQMLMPDLLRLREACAILFADER
jgi:hypothetical protein